MEFSQPDEHAAKLYLNDPVFHHLVDVIVQQIEQKDILPIDARRAAALACHKAEWDRLRREGGRIP